MVARPSPDSGLRTVRTTLLPRAIVIAVIGLVGLVGLVGVAGCPSEPGREPVTTDRRTQMKFELAREMATSIEQRRALGQDVVGECAAFRRSLLRDLKALKSPRAAALVDRLRRACASIRSAPAGRPAR